MMNGAAMLLHEMLDFIAGPHVRSRRELAEADFLQRGRREDAAADLDTRDNDVDVVVVREIRGTDNGVGERIAAAGHNLPLALGPNRDCRELHARFFLERPLAGINRCRRRERQLQIRTSKARLDCGRKGWHW